MNKLFIIDLDDTLYPNLHYYVKPQINLLEYIVNKIDVPNKEICLKQINEMKSKAAEEGYSVRPIQKLLEEVNAEHILKHIIEEQTQLDIRLIKEKGFSIERFPSSFVHTLEAFYKDATDSEKLEVYNIGMEFTHVQPGLYDGVEETLEFLIEQKDDLILLTKGDPRLQVKKIQINNLDKWFRKTCIVDEKTVETFKDLGGGYNKNNVFSVGNSIKSDINGAVKIGYRAIYIPRDTWDYEVAAKIDSEKILTLSSFKEIKSVYHALKS